MSRAIGRTTDADSYERRAEDVAGAFVEQSIDADARVSVSPASPLKPSRAPEREVPGTIRRCLLSLQRRITFGFKLTHTRRNRKFTNRRRQASASSLNYLSDALRVSDSSVHDD